MARIALLLMLAAFTAGCCTDYRRGYGCGCGCCSTYAQPAQPCNPCGCQCAPTYSTYSANGQLDPIPQQGTYVVEQPQSGQQTR